jgi:CDP-glucose 4,6-dehydratase
MIDLSFYKGKRIFITGNSGFKGSWLCHILLHAGSDVTGYGLIPPTEPSLFEQTELGKKICFIIGDIRNKDKLLKSMQDAKPDIVFHLAAQPLVRLSYQKPLFTYETNVMGTVNIFESLLATPSVKSIVNVTTDKVYENKEWLWGYRENENLCGFDPYSNSKSCSELITYCYRNSFFNCVDSPAISTARSGNVIGGGDYSENRIIPDCLRAVFEEKEIVVRHAYSTRPYQHVLDTLAGYLYLAEKQYSNKEIEGAYNFGPDDENCVTTGELVQLFCETWGQNAVWSTGEDHGPHESNWLNLDCTKAKSILGWKPHWNIKTAVEKVVEYGKAKTDIERLECINRQIEDYFFNIL